MRYILAPTFSKISLNHYAVMTPSSPAALFKGKRPPSKLPLLNVVIAAINSTAAMSFSELNLVACFAQA